MTPGRTVGEARPRRRGRPPAQSSAQTLADILRAARICFARRGYSRASIAQIAREAGVTSRAVYHYFSSKPELFAGAVEAAQRRVIEQVRASLAGRHSARDAIAGWIEAFITLFEEDPSLVQFLSVAAIDSKRHPELCAVLPARRAGIPVLNRWFVEQGMRRGEFAPGVDPAGAVTLLEVFSAGLVVLDDEQRRGDHLAMLDVLERLVDGTLFADGSSAASG